MQTIVVVLDPAKLKNPDLDLRYMVPERIEEVSGGAVREDFYDYIDAPASKSGPLLGLWLLAENAAEQWLLMRDLLRCEQFLGNELLALQKFSLQKPKQLISKRARASSQASGRTIPKTVFPPVELAKLAHRGKLENLGRGLYRLARYIPSNTNPYAVAVARVGKDAYLYGESVIAMLELAPTNPDYICVASPKRTRKTLPKSIRLKNRRRDPACSVEWHSEPKRGNRHSEREHNYDGR